MKTKTYRGHPVTPEHWYEVEYETVEEPGSWHTLDAGPSQAVLTHSPDGFSWGYAGSGPAQLALGVLLDRGIPVEDALQAHQAMKFDIIARLPRGGWMMPGDAVDDWYSKWSAKIEHMIKEAQAWQLPKELKPNNSQS